MEAISMSKYFRNFILCGEVDYFCLLCCENFVTIEELEKHIRWEKHRKLIRSQTRIPQMRRDLIYKIEPYFYCEHCNYAVEGFTNIKAHTETESHRNNKANPENVPKRLAGRYVNSETVMINDYKISKMTWHGMVYKQCNFCSILVQNVAEHMTNQSHLMKLIQSVLHCEDNNEKIYRKINTDEYQCLTCKRALPLESFAEHWINHNVQQQNNIHQINNRILIKRNNKTIFDQMKAFEFDIRTLNVSEDAIFDIDLENNKVTCKICKETVKVCRKEVFEHCSDHSNNGRKYIKSKLREAIRDAIFKKYITWKELDHGKARSEAANYGRQHYIVMNTGGYKGYCTLCDKTLSAGIELFKEHVEGKYHVRHLELKGLIRPRRHTKTAYRSDDIIFYMTELAYTSVLHKFTINETLLVDRYSYFLLKKIELGQHYRKIKCFACNEFIAFGEEKKHCLTAGHTNKFLGARVISRSSLPVRLDQSRKPRATNEFIREIHPKVYHCGYCNITIPFFETVHQHVFNLGHELQLCMHDAVEASNNFLDAYGSRPKSFNFNTNPEKYTLYKHCVSVAFSSTKKVNLG